ncbi:MAG: aldo/keto reductase [Vicinamibacteria bacterium]|nr:aldo/keto reductase [Vicinamibacteria bacterium]
MSHRDGNYDRRSFLARGVSGAVTFGLLGREAFSEKGEEKQVEKRAKDDSPSKILTRTLGRTGITLPIVNLGVMNADNPALVRRAFELGGRHFDTAAYYQNGRNEEMVGGVFRELGARDQVTIATKVFVEHQRRDADWKTLKRFYLDTMDASLRRLQTDHVDVLYAHNMSSVAEIENRGVCEALTEIKQSKKARFIGFSTHANMSEVIESATRSGFYDVILSVFNYSLHDDRRLIEALAAAARKGIGVVAMKTQCQQAWYRNHLGAKIDAFYEGEILHRALLKWVLQHEFVSTAIPGCTTLDQIETDFVVASALDYTPDERRFLESRGVKLALSSVCRQCGQCRQTCPRAADVPALVRAHMYGAAYGNMDQMRVTLNNIERGHGLEACADCTECSARCVSNVDVARNIGDLRRLCA